MRSHALQDLLLVVLGTIAMELPAVDAWPGQTTAQAAAGRGQLLADVDARLRLQMSGAHWNPLTRTLWVTAGGADGAGTWALQHDARSGAFRVLARWSAPRDEDLTQVAYEAVAADRHRLYVLKERAGEIVQALMTVLDGGDGSSAIERTWTIPAIGPHGNEGAEGLTFVPDAWLTANGFVDGAGAAAASAGGLGGLMFVAHQDGGCLFAIDLSADGSGRFAGKDHRIVGVYRTAFSESSALAFDRSIGRLYISHNTAGNRIEVTDLTSTALREDARATRRMTTLAVMASPALSSPEGFACTPWLTAEGTINPQRWAFFANDCDADASADDQAQALVWYRDFQPETGRDPVLVPGPGDDAQTARVGTAVAIAPMVQARDSRGYPLAGVPLSFAPGAGSVGHRSVTTDDRGQAGCGAWILGRTAGPQTLIVSGAGATAITLTATAAPGPPGILVAVAGDGQRAAAGTILPIAPRVVVRDAFGNPLPAVEVSFTVLSGGGSIPITHLATDADGGAGPGSWSLGSVPGGNTLRASIAGLAPAIITATGLDLTPPAAIMDLMVVTVSDTSATLSWMAPGDDGLVGTAARYDLRCDTAMIDATRFASARQVADVPPPLVGGTRQTLTVTGLTPATTYHIALTTTDDDGNSSPLSNVSSATTASAPPSGADGDGGRCGSGGLVSLLLGVLLLPCLRHLPERKVRSPRGRVRQERDDMVPGSSMRILTCLVACLAMPSFAAEPIAYGQGHRIAELANRAITESSGIACSRLLPDAFWTHNDSGGGAVLYAFDRQGRDLGTFHVAATCRDWEDIASVTIRGRALLVIGDVGDNHARYLDHTILVVEEPQLVPGQAGSGRLKAQAFPFRYTDGPHNCEALGVDPTSGVIYLISKVKGGSACSVYQLRTPLAEPALHPPFVATRLVDLDIPTVTAMDLSPDGRRAVVLTYANALEYTRDADATWAQAFAGRPRTLTVPRGPQSEGICYGADGRTLFLTSETIKVAGPPPCPLFELPLATASP